MAVQPETVTGIVVRETDYKEGDKILSILTREHGRISVHAHGVKSYKNPNRAAACVLVYGEYVVKRKGDMYTLVEGSIRKMYPKLQLTLASYGSAVYFCEIASYVGVENQVADNIMNLVLNAIYMLEKFDRPVALIKGAYEFRITFENGFAPKLGQCSRCGRSADKTWESGFSMRLDKGELLCGECRGLLEENGPLMHCEPLTPDVLQAIRYCAECDPKRLYAFSLERESLIRFSQLSQKYAQIHFDRVFRSLSFYGSVRPTEDIYKLPDVPEQRKEDHGEHGSQQNPADTGI